MGEEHIDHLGRVGVKGQHLDDLAAGCASFCRRTRAAAIAILVKK